MKPLDKPFTIVSVLAVFALASASVSMWAAGRAGPSGTRSALATVDAGMELSVGSGTVLLALGGALLLYVLVRRFVK